MKRFMVTAACQDFSHLGELSIFRVVQRNAPMNPPQGPSAKVALLEPSFADWPLTISDHRAPTIRLE
jgi:hypothetical protein